MSPSPNVFDVNIENFESSVVVASSQCPVLVAFSAAWSEPGRAMTALLAKVTEEHAGGLRMGCVDVETAPEVAQAFRVQSVPTAVLIIGGRPVDAFTGNKTEAEVREFLSTHILPSSDGNPLEAAKEMASVGHLAEAVGMLSTWLDDNPEDVDVRIALAGFLLDAEDAEGAREQFDAVPEDARESAEARSVAARLDLIEGAGDVDSLRATLEANPKDVGARIELGKAMVAKGETEDGLDELLEAAMRDMEFEDGAPRKAMIEVFQALGPADPLTLEFQQRLSVLLCS